MGANAWDSFDDCRMFARDCGLSDNLSGIVCKGLWRASWFEETRPDNGIYFKATYTGARYDCGTGDIPCGIRLHTVSAAELDWKWVYEFAGAGSGYCRAYTAGDWFGDGVLFVLLECDRRGELK